ncbi:hypothetical protein LTR17_003602 [Elasticomyces elasticus]|nr:hypothetical protein LTR17_003602 [Elasticomyces elasticus]
MADPLSFLGAALGVVSLVIQTTEQCIKAYMYFCEATCMDESYRYLRMRLQIETQRFLHFCLEAGTLSSDEKICATLRVNLALLLAVLAEVKDLLHKYAAKNGKYESIMSQERGGSEACYKPETDVVSQLLFSAINGEQVRVGDADVPQEKARLRGLRNLRKIIVEPRRLVWATLDKQSLEGLLARLGTLNAFLIALLDGSQAKRLQKAMDASLLEILQLRNDIRGLRGLVEALNPISQDNFPMDTTIQAKESPMYRAMADQIEGDRKRKAYLTKLARIKMECTTLNDLSNQANISLSTIHSIGTKLSLADFSFVGDCQDNEQRRQTAHYRRDAVWVEWKRGSSHLQGLDDGEQIENRTRLLTDLLASEKPEGFRVAPCLGYLKATTSTGWPRFGIVFKYPPGLDNNCERTTLADLFNGSLTPSLSARMSLCIILARSLHSFHAVNWMYKGLRSDNILFFNAGDHQPDITAPYVSGFELSRPSILNEMTEKPDFSPIQDLYRHPDAQSSRTDGSYHKAYDIYSLGIVLIEIAFWRHIRIILDLTDSAKIRPSMLRSMKDRLLCSSVGVGDPFPEAFLDQGTILHQVAAKCGDGFRDVVETCLRADEAEAAGPSRESEAHISVQLARLFDEEVLRKLEKMAAALGVEGT